MDSTPTDDRELGDGYEAPTLSDYGTIEEWTQGTMAAGIVVSIIL